MKENASVKWKIIRSLFRVLIKSQSKFLVIEVEDKITVNIYNMTDVETISLLDTALENQMDAYDRNIGLRIAN